jgi:hypothetical protein
MKIICGLVVLSALGWGQDAPAKLERKLIQLKYVDAGRVSRLLRGQNQTLLTMESDDQLHAIAVTGTPEMVASVEEGVKRLDVPPIDFELTIYLISSSAQAGDQLPEALASTAKQLHGVFAFKGYQLLDSFVLRGRDGQRGKASGTISKDGKSSTYSFQYDGAAVSGEAPKIVNLHSLNLNVRFYNGTFDKNGQQNYRDTGLNTDVDARDGQKIVVGKSDVNNGESPLILVVTAKVVE